MMIFFHGLRNYLQGLLYLLLLTVLFPDLKAQSGQFVICTDWSCVAKATKPVFLNLRKGLAKAGTPDPALYPNIIGIDLSRNKLSQLPDWVCDCSSLRILDVSRNRLAQLPDCLGSLTSLHHFISNRNPLASLPVSMAGLDSLETLDLWQTWIDAFEPAFAHWQGRLKVLDLRDIRMSREQQQAITALFRGSEIRMSSPCNCRPHLPRVNGSSLEEQEARD
ncbi:MAG: leucine-rich repeat domain-containing protein [Lentimicrobiaceae bacterium]|nr:leucine-rich repeat domain-containing protein [Lentimicrobiaceae bacterium]